MRPILTVPTRSMVPPARCLTLNRRVGGNDLEGTIGPAVASVLERLVLAAATPGLKFEGEEESV